MNEFDIEVIKEELRDKKIVISMFFGEFGWELQRFQGHLRYLKHNVYTDWDFVVMIRPHMHIFYDDFITYSLDFPEWFYNLDLDCDGYEAVLPNSKPGSMTPPEVYQNIVLLLKNICGYCKEYELLLPPRGCSMILETRPQMFFKFDLGKKIKPENPIVVVFPRARSRASNRNVPEYVWAETVLELSKSFTVVLAGTPSGACLGDMQGNNIINLINYNEIDKTEKIMTYLNNSILSVSSQSGGTHFSLLSGCPSYIIGHEKDRHTVKENRLVTPTSFRVVADYRAIDAQTILGDLKGFIAALMKSGWFSEINRPSLEYLKDKKDLIGVEIGTDCGKNALNMLENLDIKKLYLVDPYSLYRSLKNKGCNLTEEKCIECEEKAHKLLEKYSDKIEWVKKLSEDAVDDIPDEVDFVYVDGNHRYEYVKRDAELYYPKVKEGGLISFHDFDYQEVNKAVVDTFGDNINVKNCKDNEKRYEAWIIKPTNTDRIINQDYNKLIELVS